MDKRWRSQITAAFLAVTVLVIAVMLSGTLHRTSHITLPSSEQTPGQAAVTRDALTVVEVTPETVQAAVATLSRPQEYRRTVTVEQLWTGGGQRRLDPDRQDTGRGPGSPHHHRRGDHLYLV